MGCRVVSNANTTDARNAREAPAKRAAMPTRAAMRTSTPSCGRTAIAAAPSTDPSAPPSVKSGARVPPEVPLPSAIDQERSFHRQNTSAARPASDPESRWSMLS